MLQLDPRNRPSAEDIVGKLIPAKDFMKTMVKSNSQPGLLNTIKVPRDLTQLKVVLPGKRYKDLKEKNENRLPRVDSVVSSNVSVAKEILKPSGIQMRRPESRVVLEEKKPLPNNNNNVPN
eukprot:CAMPEP_0116917404 /NCGR_PEP_ID=MMETSP0467-20121206/19119_1 /TAXON_ID=283647 /ORGANISM="Mesodinium pulex, Strain SPMC105" /LENGTH=120 /DNA_ID=CAMNT_0004594483 /DNA_START=720 /DNA_END=1085 /DNA_ORIENTATION=-